MTTKDIIDRALQIADLENSSFISYSEYSSLLKEQWQGIYQKSIDKGDLYWLKECKITSNKMPLPCDFYQLYSVEDQYGNQLLRKTKSEYDKNVNRYEIVNGVLFTYNINKDVKLKYYPKPYEVHVKPDTLDLQIDSVIDASSKYFLAGTSGAIDVYTIDESSQVYDGTQTFDKAYIDNKCLVLMTGKEATIVNFKSSMEEVLTVDFIMKSNGVLYYVIDRTVFRAFDSATIEELSEGYDYTVVTYGTFNDGLYVFYHDNILDFVRHGEIVATKDKIDFAFLPQVYNSNLYYKTVEGTFRNDVLVWDAEFDTICLIKEDSKTGYGIVSADSILSCFEDTDLVYPNNMFYTVLAYYLAIQYKIKQNADISGLTYSLQQAEYTFYNSLSNDNDMPVRITNAYARNIRF